MIFLCNLVTIVFFRKTIKKTISDTWASRFEVQIIISHMKAK